MKLHKEIKEKRPELATRKGVMFHQDNARPHMYIFGHSQKIIGIRLGSDAVILGNPEWFTVILLNLTNELNQADFPYDFEKSFDESLILNRL